MSELGGDIVVCTGCLNSTVASAMFTFPLLLTNGRHILRLELKFNSFFPTFYDYIIFQTLCSDDI